MKSQWIPAIGLAATIALCGYMAARLDADRQQRDGHTVTAPITQPAASGTAVSK